MSRADLSDRQERVLRVLVDRFAETESLVTGATVAEAVGCSKPTLRKDVRVLRSLDLVEGVPGSRGGYRPTAKAYDALGRREVVDPASLTLAHEFERLDVTVEEIDLLDVNDPETCRVRVRFRDHDRAFERGDAIAVGPTPGYGLLVAGRVAEIDPRGNRVVLDGATLEVPSSTE